MNSQTSPTTYPLTNMQRLMWIGQMVHPDVPLYNMIHMNMLYGTVDEVAFEYAIRTLVATSENLRTIIQLFDGEPIAVIADDVPRPYEFVDLSDAPNPEAALSLWSEKRRAQSFKMDEQLFDLVLIKLAPDLYAWYWVQHHIATDVWSSRLVQEHLANFYQQAITNGKIDPPAMPSYQDHVSDEQATRQTEKFEQSLAYWQEELQKPTETLQLYDAPSTTGSARTIRRALPLDTQMMDTLEQVASERGIRSFSKDLTYSNIFAGLIFAFMHRLTGQNTLRLGLPFANRSTPEARATVGMFIEIMSLHIEFDESETFRTLIKKVANQYIQALRHMHTGISSSEVNRSYDILLNYIPISFSDFGDIPTEVRWIHSGYGDSDHQIRIQVHDYNNTGQLELLFDFRADTFSETEQQRAVDHFERMMNACLADIDQPISAISMLSEEEHSTLIVDFNATDAKYPSQKTVVDLFDEQCQRSPSDIAISSRDETQLTYEQLSNAVSNLAQQFGQKGINVGDFVPVCMEHSQQLLVTLLAILKVGATYVPLDPQYPNERLQFILDDIGEFPLIACDEQNNDRFESSDNHVVADLNFSSAEFVSRATPDRQAYMIYTSGSTGQPKGVLVHHAGLTNYLSWASENYTDGVPTTFALYSSLAFDLTVTSIFVPLISGGTVRIYPDDGAQGLIIREVFTEDAVDVIKLTPSHLALVRDIDLTNTRIKTLIVGGEDFKTELAREIYSKSNGAIKQYNEYGPTEATVACMLHEFDPKQDTRRSVPIGKPANNMHIYILNEELQPSPVGVIGEIYISGINVASGYLKRPELTQERFLTDPFDDSRRMYKTGDLARWLPTGQLEFLGRRDAQVKVGGARIELGEIESQLLAHPSVTDAVVVVQPAETQFLSAQKTIKHCVRCGLASDFPGVTFNENDVCSVCLSYDSYADNAAQYFKDMDQLETLAEKIKARSTGEYDCISLLSGGKDSTYMLYHLVKMGLRVLTFTLDNGYISDEAKANIRRITSALDVDHVWGETPFMNSIFVDSLERYANVCNGCFKTIYTLAVNIAREKGIPTIVTGLSRGQFFETRLTEELFTADDFNAQKIDESIAKARRAYHQRDDIISRSLDVDVFRDETLYQDIEFVDFYRYCDVDLDDLYTFLKEKGLWVRPSDTGRSTNCLINDVGIYVHMKKRGFHNYALPYSWDVRLGHKTREEALHELNDDIDEQDVQRIMREIGYSEPLIDDTGQDRLVAYYVADDQLTSSEIREFLSQRLPIYMMPTFFVALDALPLTLNGKVNQAALPTVTQDRDTVSTVYVAPSSDAEETLADIWQSVLNMPRIGVNDNFFDLGGHSLPAIRIASRIESTYDITLPIEVFFANPTIAQLAIAVENILLADIESLSDDELLRLLSEEDD